MHKNGQIYTSRESLHLPSKLFKQISTNHDQYRHNVDDLQRFYDRYCKNIDNGWERDTPPVRLTLISFGGKDVVERPEQEVSTHYQHTQYAVTYAFPRQLTTRLVSFG